VGVDRAAWGPLGEGVGEACEGALGVVDVVDVRLPDAALAGAASIVVLMAEASQAWGATLDADPGGFGDRVRAALAIGREVPAGAYLRAKRVRTLVARELRELFASHRLHAVATPTVPVTAAPAGAATVALGGREQPLDAAHSRFAALAPLVGHPAFSVPCGLDPAGLPIGLQLMARPGGEHVLAALGARVEAGAWAAVGDKPAFR
jgi:aspartyl-tRNA(Asn)/glutamyl-tRNA(Gln) amidotransferase subunit A